MSPAPPFPNRGLHWQPNSDIEYLAHGFVANLTPLRLDAAALAKWHLTAGCYGSEVIFRLMAQTLPKYAEKGPEGSYCYIMLAEPKVREYFADRNNAFKTSGIILSDSTNGEHEIAQLKRYAEAQFCEIHRALTERPGRD